MSSNAIQLALARLPWVVRILFIGAFSLAHSPLVSGMKGDDEHFHELLSERAHAEKIASNVCPPPLTHP